MFERFKIKKSLGQHFLNNSHVPEMMSDAARIEAGDTVVEIGPGTGRLTRSLLQRGAVVIALETDARAIAVLEETFSEEIAQKKLTVILCDVRNLSFSDLPIQNHAYKVVANIPYYLSGMLFRLFLTSSVQPSCLVFLVQKEVAERICRDKKESLLSLSVKAFGDPTYVHTVKKGNFTPQPKVDSAIVLVDNVSRKHFESVHEELFFKVLHLGFGSRRKQLIGNLSKEFDRNKLIHIFSTLSIDVKVRGEDLALDTWLRLVSHLDDHS